MFFNGLSNNSISDRILYDTVLVGKQNPSKTTRVSEDLTAATLYVQ